MAEDTGAQIAAALKPLAPLAPGFAGAVVSIAWQTKLTRRAALTSFVIGLCCAMWLAPMTTAVLRQVWPWGDMPLEVGQAVTLLWGLFGMIVLSAVAAVLPERVAVTMRLLKPAGVAGEG